MNNTSHLIPNNKLFYGDNLTIMKEFIPSNSIDLIYLDPPFNSKRNYNLMYKNMTGGGGGGGVVPEQIEAFCDTWEMDDEKHELLENMIITLKNHSVDADFVKLWDYWIKALRQTRQDLTAYLLYMTVRLLEMKRILKHTGSIYLHCDLTASHTDKYYFSTNFIRVPYKLNKIPQRKNIKERNRVGGGVENGVGQKKKS